MLRLVVPISMGLLLTLCEKDPSRPTGPQRFSVYEDQGWYRARPEPEIRWQGTLEKQDPPTGPGARSSLEYVLITQGRRLPVYAAGVTERLAPFAGREVISAGKLIDLSSEGFGQELWFGWIAVAKHDSWHKRSSEPSR